jgi:hypothetical protein
MSYIWPVIENKRFQTLDRLLQEMFRFYAVMLALFFVIGAFYGLLRLFLYRIDGRNYSEKKAFRFGIRATFFWLLLLIFSGIMYANGNHAYNAQLQEIEGDFWFFTGQFLFWTSIIGFIPIFILGMIGHFFESNE